MRLQRYKSRPQKLFDRDCDQSKGPISLRMFAQFNWATEVHEIKHLHYISAILELLFWKVAKEYIALYFSIYNVFRWDPV